MMALERWRPFSRFRALERMDPFHDLADIQSEMNRLFDAFFGRPGRTVGLLDRVWAPVVDVYETADELVVTTELPGAKEKDVHVSIVGDVLTIKGERKQDREVKEEHYHRMERFYGSFERHIPLPIPVEADKVKARFRDGVLEIRLPKAEEIKPKEIKIEVG